MTNGGDIFSECSYVCINEKENLIFLSNGLIFEDHEFLYKTKQETQEKIDNILRKKNNYFYEDYRKIKDINYRIIAVENKKIVNSFSAPLTSLAKTKIISRFELLDIE
ncbi:MAG TPA: hypothetical protein VMZ91_14080 [Candidatus Paceibacterota bacterium]|nr:hypothetical protein [Candidatus Paceibacterota bacterium]